MPKIELKNVYKIFGEDPQSVLPLLEEGATKEEILEERDHTVGLDNVSLSIEEGETFVCMGLSGSGKSTLIRHINRLIDPTKGEVLVDGVNVLQFSEDELLEFLLQAHRGHDSETSLFRMPRAWVGDGWDGATGRADWPIPVQRVAHKPCLCWSSRVLGNHGYAAHSMGGL